jgi:conjugative transposon TraM protein
MNNAEQPENAAAPETKPEVKQEPPKSAHHPKEPSSAQMHRRRMMMVVPLFFLLFAGVIWWIFSPSKKEDGTEAAGAGFNMELPTPTGDGMAPDKITAYKDDETEQQEQERMRSLREFSAIFGGEDETTEERLAREEWQLRMAPKPPEYYENPERFAVGGSSRERVGALKSSAIAYDNINRQLGSWNDSEPAVTEGATPSAVDERMSELERRLAEAEARDAERDAAGAMLEKSYEMASRYMPGGAYGAGSAEDAATGHSAGKAEAKPVARVRKSVVSLLSAPISDDEFTRAFSRPRNMGFLTAAGDEEAREKNTIRACTYRTVTLTDGKELPIRLLEPMMADGILIPAGTVVTGACRIEGERMTVEVNSIQYEGNIIPVELTVYDMDGRPGIAVPGSDEVNAMREVASSLAQSAGTGITISDDATSQLVADMGKGLIQGVSQYASKKMSIVRVTVKANHGLMLLPKMN